MTKKMSKVYSVIATRTHTYEIKIRANSQEEALSGFDDFIADDFEPFETNAEWNFEINPYDSHNQSCVMGANDTCIYCGAIMSYPTDTIEA